MAIQYYEKALQLASKRKDKVRETSAYFDLGDSYRNENQIETAIEYFEKALEIAREQEDKKNETKAYFELGDSYWKKNHIQNGN